MATNYNKTLTEDQVRDKARQILGLNETKIALSGVGQLTTFNQLGFQGINDKPDGWFLPYDTKGIAIILETKNSSTVLGDKHKKELLKNCNIVSVKYKNIVGILYNGEDAVVYKNGIFMNNESKLYNKEYYIGLFEENKIDRQKIYSATKAINDALHFGLTLKNLYHRMIFTACALVAKRYDAHLTENVSYDVLRFTIKDKLKSVLNDDIKVNAKLQYLIDRFDAIHAETPHNLQAIAIFVNKVNEISEYFTSSYWNGEDVMAIFFNEFNRYKGKSESGQVFTPEHIASLMYRIIDVNKNDVILDAACGSGTFLVKSMCNMLKEAGGEHTVKAKDIKTYQLFGIEKDMEIFTLACANMLIHKDGKTNIEHLDTRYEEAYNWIISKNITKVLMNPPFESKYGCLDIVLNVLNAVADRDRSLHHLCAFILPDKKLEKKNQTSRVKKILKRHRLTHIIKLPEKTFEGVKTSIFVFEAGKPQANNKIFGCYIKEDGLDTVKNQGRQDVYGKWNEIENYWVKVIKHEQIDDTVKYIDPKESLSYTEDFDVKISQSLFNTTIIESELYKNSIDFIDFCDKFSRAIIYQTDFPLEHKEWFDKLLLLAKTYQGDCWVDTHNWKTFKLSQILHQTGRGQRLRKQDRKEGEIPLATAGFVNQGISNYIGNDEQNTHVPSITIDMFCNCFLREYNFACDDNVYVFQTNENVSKNAKLFIVSVINAYSQRFANKYNYDNQFREHTYKKESIKLPVDPQGNPDWEFMDNYIKSLPYSANL